MAKSDCGVGKGAVPRRPRVAARDRGDWLDWTNVPVKVRWRVGDDTGAVVCRLKAEGVSADREPLGEAPEGLGIATAMVCSMRGR